MGQVWITVMFRSDSGKVKENVFIAPSNNESSRLRAFFFVNFTTCLRAFVKSYQLLSASYSRHWVSTLTLNSYPKTRNTHTHTFFSDQLTLSSNDFSHMLWAGYHDCERRRRFLGLRSSVAIIFLYKLTTLGHVLWLFAIVEAHAAERWESEHRREGI